MVETSETTTNNLWLQHREKWLNSNKLSMPMSNTEHRVGSFLKKEECKSFEYFSDAVKEMEDYCWNSPNTNNKYLLGSDADLLANVLKTFSQQTIISKA